MSNPWIIIITGVLFSLAGVYLFHRNAYEENRKVLMPVLVIIAGVILMSIGFAKHLHLIK